MQYGCFLQEKFQRIHTHINILPKGHLCKCGCENRCRKKKFSPGHVQIFYYRKKHPILSPPKDPWQNLCMCSCGKFCKQFFIQGHGDHLSGGKKLSYFTISHITINMLSSWEVVYAKYLDFQNIIWQYEPKFFKLSSGHRYLPDFYLPDLNEYHEVKGWLTQAAKEKMELFRKEYSNEKLIVLMGQDLENLGIKI